MRYDRENIANISSAIPISTADFSDAERIAALINSAYRGEISKQGWTTEADLLAGRRTDCDEIGHLLRDNGSMFLLYETQAELAGTVLLQKQSAQVYLSMLAVCPSLQAGGIGKQLLAAAERTAKEIWSAEKAAMSVIACRNELIAFYERRGYRRTGISEPFPVNPALWTPKVNDLRLELLEKRL